MATSQNVPFSLFPSTFLPVCRHLFPLLQGLSFFVSHVLSLTVPFSFSKRQLFTDSFKYSKTAPKRMRLVLKLGSDVYGLPSQETYLDSQNIHLDVAKTGIIPDICK